MPKIRLFMMALMGCFALGCGSAAVDQYKVSGVLTGKDGKPLANINVQFSPVDVKGVQANGTTNANGEYTLATNKGEGAAAGKYKVVLSVEETAADASSAGADTNKPPPAGKAYASDPGMNKKGGSVIPKAYQDANSSPEEVEVKSGQDNEINIKIKSK